MKTNETPLIELDNFWPYQAVALADQISRYTLSVVKSEAGLNLSQWRVLAAVAEKPGRTAKHVTEITPMDKTIVSRALSSLIRSGLIKKSPDPSDKRRLYLYTTPAGDAVYKSVAYALNHSFIDSFAEGPSSDNLNILLKAFREKMTTLPPIT